MNAMPYATCHHSRSIVISHCALAAKHSKTATRRGIHGHTALSLRLSQHCAPRTSPSLSGVAPCSLTETPSTNDSHGIRRKSPRKYRRYKEWNDYNEKLCNSSASNAIIRKLKKRIEKGDKMEKPNMHSTMLQEKTCLEPCAQKIYSNACAIHLTRFELYIIIVNSLPWLTRKG